MTAAHTNGRKFPGGFLWPLVAGVAALAACQTGETGAQRAQTPEAGLLGAAAASGCFTTDRIPATYEDVTETRVIAPPQRDAAGRVIEPGQMVRETNRVQTRPAEDRVFAIPCPEDLQPGFVASLQRALAARGLYEGPITGEFDAATGRAVRAWQAPQGLDSAVLSLTAAQQLGLVPLPREAL